MLLACWKMSHWYQLGPLALWPGRRLFTWQSGLWITERSSQTGLPLLGGLALYSFLSLKHKLPPLWLQDSSGARQWHRTDWHHSLSLLPSTQIHLQWLSPWSPAEAKDQHQAEWTDGGDAFSGQCGGVRLDGGDWGADKADGGRRHHCCRSDLLHSQLMWRNHETN